MANIGTVEVKITDEYLKPLIEKISELEYTISELDEKITIIKKEIMRLKSNPREESD